jgi:hypothetical protein
MQVALIVEMRSILAKRQKEPIFRRENLADCITLAGESKR